MTAPIKLLIADDDAVMRHALADYFGADSRFEVTPTAADADAAAELAELHRPDVALLDVRMPGGGGPAAARAIRDRSPGTRMVALSAHEDRETVLEMMENGAIGYIVKGGDADDIVDAVLKAASGWATLAPRVATGVVEALAAQLQVAHADALAREVVAQRIQRAVQGTGLTMAYQPIWDLPARAVVGFEALARFSEEPHRTPDVWFAEAADSGLASELQMTAALLAISGRPAVSPAGFLAVNLSPGTVVGNLASILETIARPDVVVEITEHDEVTDYDALNRALDALRGRGTRVAVDDAGSGYASFRHILALEPQIIKLDVTLTAGIDSDPKRRALASALIAFAASTGSDVVAEGIETVAELDTLVDLGVSLGQGYLLGRPMTVEHLLEDTPRWPQAAKLAAAEAALATTVGLR